MKIYNKAQIESVTQLDLDALEAIEEAFAALGRGLVTMPPILSMNIEENNGEVDVKTAHIRGNDTFAIKISPGFFDNPKLGLPSLNGLMVLFSAKTGLVDSLLLDEGYLTDTRTALAGALAAKWLSRADANTVAVMGSGLQAELQVAALRLVRPIRQVRVFARSEEKANAYRTKLAEKYGLDVIVCQSAKEACAEAHIVVTTTPSTEPLLAWDDLPPGIHVTAMGSDNAHKQELESDILEKADYFVVDRLSQSATLGELHHFQGEFPKHIFELGTLIAEQKHLRTDDMQITVCDLTGTGVQDTAIAGYTEKRLAD